MAEIAPPDDIPTRTPKEVEPPISSVVIAVPVPPLEGAAMLQLTKPVVLGQLETEIADAVKTESVQIVMSGPQDGNVPISSENPAQLWLLPPAIDLDVVAEVVKAHTPHSDWGIPSVMKAYNAVWEKIEKNPDASISAAEVKALVVGLAIRVNAQQALTSETSELA